ncbi:DUF5372 family protein [Acrocarpospora sp. B8E8]|uniref:DUF5372 family protein n=1 Tax=Acrocarpospora sp. B8E8 TaxID=3153572 RepID=UPI00325E3FBF
MGFVIVTHPFHPLKGQRLDILYVKRRGSDVVFVCSGGVSGQITLPAGWTDRGEPPQQRRLSAEHLAALNTLVRALGPERLSGEALSALDVLARGTVEGR